MAANVFLRYFISGSTDLLNLNTQNPDYVLDGQQFIATGSSGVNVVHAALGVDLDARNLLGGEDVVIFSRSWNDYTKDNTTVPGAIIFNYTDTSTGLSEKVTVLNGSTNIGVDKLIFTDGSLTTSAASHALKTSAAPVTGGSFGLEIRAADLALLTVNQSPLWDTNTTRNSYVLPAPSGNTLKAFASTNITQGATFAQGDAGQTLITTGSGQVDKVYVKAGAVVDARSLLGGEDIIYLTGNWSDYTKSLTAVSGAIQLTRYVTINNQNYLEKITVLNGSTSLGKDRLIFADGSVLTSDATAALKTSAAPQGGATYGLTISAADVARMTSTKPGGGSSWDANNVTPDIAVVQGSITAGSSAAGLKVELFDKNGTKIRETYTEEGGTYKLGVDKRYTGQALTIKVTDPDVTDGKGYVDETTGQSKELTTALRSAFVFGSEQNQTVQVTPLTELAARKLVSSDGIISASNVQDVTKANKAVARLFGLGDDVDVAKTTAPAVAAVGSSGLESNSYGKALALLSGMDSVNERQGAASGMEATLARLTDAIEINVSGTVQASFKAADTETLSLLAQAVAEVAANTAASGSTDTSLVDALANIAMDAAKSSIESNSTDTTVFISSNANVLGAGKQVVLNFRFEVQPSLQTLGNLKAQLQVSGGELTDLVASNTDTSLYSATFKQLGAESPKVWVGGNGFFSNDLSMELDLVAPTLKVASMQGLGMDGRVKQILKIGDTLRVALTADESLIFDRIEKPALKLNIGGVLVDAAYKPTLSSMRSLVFEYTIGNDKTDADGVSVVSLSFPEGVTLSDLAGNTAHLDTTYNGLAPLVDTIAPVVLSQAPLDGSLVGNAGVSSLTLNFMEVVSLAGSGFVQLKLGANTVLTLQASSGKVSADGLSVSFALPPNTTLTAGDYTVVLSNGLVKDLAGNALAQATNDGVWNFTVGSVNLSVDKVSDDNLMNANEIVQGLILTGKLTGPSVQLEQLSSADLSVWLRPVAGGESIQAEVNGFDVIQGTWRAQVADPTVRAGLSGGYVVQVQLHKDDVVSTNAASVLVVDRQAQIALGLVAGDERISLLEKSIVDSGRDLAIGFVAEKGASGILTFTNAADATRSVTKNFQAATGQKDSTSIKLNKADLQKLGSGSIDLNAQVTDAAGNTNTVQKTFVVDAAAAPAKVVDIILTSSSNQTTLVEGDRLWVDVKLDKAVTVSGTGLGFTLAMGVENSNSAVVAAFTGLSADRKSMRFEYKVKTTDVDANGISYQSNPLQIGSVMIKDLDGLAPNLSIEGMTYHDARFMVDGSASQQADLAVSVKEAGVDANGVVLTGVPTATGRVLTGALESLSKVSFSGNEKSIIAGTTASSLGATKVQGAYGTWSIGADGSYRYMLDNTDTDTQALGVGVEVNDVLTFTKSGGQTGTLTVTVHGTNDAPTVSTQTARANEGDANAVTLNLGQGLTDPEGNLLVISDITYTVNGRPTTGGGIATPGSLAPTGMGVQTGSDGTTLLLYPNSSAFNSLKAGQVLTIVARYKVSDGLGGSAMQTATFIVTGTNDAPEVSIAPQASTVYLGRTMTPFSVAAFIDADGDLLSYSASKADGSALPTWLKFDALTRTFSGTPPTNATPETLSLKVSATDGQAKVSTSSFSVSVASLADLGAPTASTVASEAPRSYDRGVLQGTLADTVMLRFSESVKVADIKAAMAAGQIKLQDGTGALHSLGNGAVLDAYTPSTLVVSGLGSGADGAYTSTYNSATGTSPAVSFSNGFGLSSPNNFTVNTSTTIYTRTAEDGTKWYIWQQNGWASWIVSQSSPVDSDGKALPWFLAGTSSNTEPASRTAVLGVSNWYSKSGALSEGTDPWANALKLSSANIESQGYGRTFLLALGTGSTAQAGDVLVIDRNYVKDTTGILAQSHVSFTLPVDITRPAVSANTPATLVGLDAQGNTKTDALVAGNKVRVILTMAEPVSVSSNADPSVSLLMDTATRQASINRAESFKNGATTSTTLVFDYVVKEGDLDGTGGIQVGAYNRNNSNITDLAGNRFTAPTDLAETSNTIRISADSTAPTLASISVQDRGILNSGAVADTFTFKFNELVNVDKLEQAFANGKVKVTNADGTVTRTLGAGATVEATYPSEIVVTGFSAAANGSYTSLWSPAQGKNLNVPSFTGFAYVAGSPLTPDSTYPIYKHTDSAGQEFYFWRPSGYAGYVLTPVSSEANGAAQTWWSGGTSQTTVSAESPREGVLLAADWYARSGTSTSATKLSTLPGLEATGLAFTYSLSFGTDNDVQQGDKLVIDKSAVADALGNATSTDLVMSLPADITRPVLGTAVVKAYKNNWDNSTQTSTYTETSSALGQHDLIRVEIPVNEPIKLYYSGGSTGSVALDIGGQTRYAYLNMALSSADGSTGWGFSSNKLVYEYWIQAGDNDTQGGITVGAMSRGSVGIYDAAGNRPVTPVDVAETSNNISVVDNTSPSLWISYASGNKVVLAASEKLDANAMPDKSAFSVSVDGKALTIDSVALTSNGTSLVLTLASGSALTVGQYASVSYTKPSLGAVLQDLAGNSANSMPNYSITASTAPTIQFAQASVDLIEVAGMSELWFEVKYSDLVAISGTPRLALTLTALDGSTSTVYADYQPYSGVTNGQNTVGFAYKPAANAQGQVHVNSLDLNGGSITAYGSVGTVPASTTLNGSEFFTPYTWIYPSLINSVTGDAGNNLLAPWWADPATTPKTLTSTTVTAGEGGRDVLAMTVLLPDTVNSAQAAAAYRLDYQVTTEGARQVKLMHGTDVVDTYTVPANGNWPNGVEQLLFAGVYKDSAGKVQMAEMNQIRLTVAQAEYTDPANSNDRWIQGTLNADYINLSARDTVQKISVNTEQGNDTIVGHDGVDIIRAGGGTNTISAGAGNDILVISNGSQDLMDGGEGTDILRFELAGNNKKVTVDADGKMYVYSATGTWTNGFSLDSNGWVARYRISSDYGTDGTNRIGVYDIALERVVATVKNVEQLQWRLDDNLSERATNTLKVGTSGDDTLSGADVVLAGAGNDTITLNSNTLRISDWRNGTRPVLIDGGSGRDVLTLDSTSFYGHLNQVFENNTSNNINASRVIKNIEGLKFTGSTNNTVLLSAADITNLYAAGNTNTNVWSEIINSPDKRQFKIDGAVGLNITDTNGWTLQTNTVSYGGVTYKIADHSSGVQLILDSRIGISGALSNGGFSGGATVPSTTSPTSLSISSAATNGQITEGNAGTTDVTFTVTRSGDTTGATSVNWSLVNSSTDSNDFVTGQATSGTVNFTAGQTSLTITIQVQGDTTAEQNESFSVKLSNAVGASLGFAQTQVVINNDDGQATGTGPAPKVELVRAESGPIVSPGSSLRFVVELDQSVQVIGTPRLVLTLTDPTGAQSAKTVYANFQPYSDTTNGIWNHQSSMAFSYNYAEQDAVGAGWTYHIQGLENFNGSSIKSVEGNSLNVAADLTLNNVAITSGTWLYTSDVNGTTGTANNDLIGAFDAAGTVPRSLSSTSADGGAGERDVVGIPVLLPSLVQTQVQASSYYLNYEVSTSNGAVTGRYIKVYQEGNSTAIDTYTLPLDRSTWPANVEGLGYFLQFKDSNGQIQDTDHPNDSLIFWKTSSTSTDAINDDITHQGSYLNDTIDLSSTDPSVRVLVRGNQGNDVITGHAGTDVINGDGGNDNINVGAGNDMVFLSAGVDTLAGGEGTDILAVYVKGQEAMPSFGADGKLQLLSALGTWSNNGFTTNTNGYRLDWTFDFDGQTGALLAQRAGSSEVSTASGFEKIRIYKDLYQVVQGETTDTFDVLVGTSGNDALNTTPYQGILHGLDGDDTINVVTPDTPVIMGGNGNDTIVFAAAYFADSGNSDGMLIHGGAGIDTLRLGTDVTGMDLSAPSANSGSMLRSIEAIDLTGGTSAGNSVTMTVAWMRDLTDLVNNTHSLTIQGDGNDRVNLLIADGWSLQTSSSQAGYSQYSTSKDGETLNLYVTSSILEGSRGVISA